MPRKPKKPCAYPGCPNLTEGRYCPEHQSKVNSEYEKYGRDPRTKKRYGRAWKRIRDKYVMEHPFCELCFQRGIIVETEEERLNEKIRMQKEAVEKLEDEADAMPNGLSVSMGEIQADHLTRELTEAFVDKVLVWPGQKIEIRWKFRK